MTISIHRNENIYNKKRLIETVEFLIKIKNNYFEKAHWYMHSQTEKTLEKLNLIKTLNEEGIFTSGLIQHKEFINEIQTSKCVVTDGETVIEECKIIGTPTYVLLNKLENKNSEGENIFISKYDHDKNYLFFENIQENISKTENDSIVSPSREIVDYIEKITFKGI